MYIRDFLISRQDGSGIKLTTCVPRPPPLIRVSPRPPRPYTLHHSTSKKFSTNFAGISKFTGKLNTTHNIILGIVLQRVTIIYTRIPLLSYCLHCTILHDVIRLKNKSNLHSFIILFVSTHVAVQ